MFKRLVVLFLFATTSLLVAFLYVKIGPYRTIWAIHKSIKVGDFNQLNEYIDFQSVRIGLKDQFEGVLTEMSLIEFDDPIKFLVLSGMSKALIDGMVDRFFEPKNITNWGSGIIDSSDIIDKEIHNLESLFSYLNRLPSYFKKMNSMITLKYHSSEICDATIIDGNLAIGETVIVFQRNGINWKIILIEFSKDFLRNKIK